MLNLATAVFLAGIELTSAAEALIAVEPTPPPTSPAASTPTPTPTPMPFDETLITPGPFGFIVTFGIAAVTVLLVLDMVRRVRRVRLRQELESEAERARAADAGNDSAT